MSNRSMMRWQSGECPCFSHVPLRPRRREWDGDRRRAGNTTSDNDNDVVSYGSVVQRHHFIWSLPFPGKRASIREHQPCIVRHLLPTWPLHRFEKEKEYLCLIYIYIYICFPSAKMISCWKPFRT